MAPKRIALLLAFLPVCAFAAGITASSGTHFSPLTQITPRNVAHLGIAWAFDTGLKSAGFEDTPLVADGTMYVLLPNEAVVALDPDSGRRIWTYDPHESRTRVSRGLAWWPGTRKLPARLVIATADGHLIELDPHSGEPIPGFAHGGVLDLRAIEARGYPYAPFGFTSPPAVYGDLLILGPESQEGPSTGPPGLVTAVDAVTGRIVWTFHTLAQPGHPESATWGPGGWKNRSGPAAWANITADPRLGLVFVPTANPADSYYGADRPGTNLYANSVVALDARTGRLRWYYQFVHHDLWDTDTVSTTLITAWKDGREVPAVAALTKSALLFVLDRRTGEPIFGVRERPVAARSDVPGEHPWPTEPYPIEPPPLARQSATAADVSTVTPASEAYCRDQFAQFRALGPYTPFQLQAGLEFPSTVGGGNWGGASFDPVLGYVYVNTSDLGGIAQMAKAGSGIVARRAFKPKGAFAEMLKHLKPMPYHNAYIAARFVDENGFPCQQPPWGLLSAVDMHTGHLAWQIRLGNYPELARAGAPPTGTPNLGGSMVTASGLVFIAATMDGDFRAFDARTGRMLWQAGLGGYGEATPMTYLGRNGKQYVVVAVGGPGLLRGVHLSISEPRVRLLAFVLGGKPSPPTKASLATNSNSIAPLPRGKAAASGRLPAGAGQELVQQDCTLCHGVDTITRSHLSRSAWQATVRDMMNRGAPVTASQYATVVEYLTHNFGASGSK